MLTTETTAKTIAAAATPLAARAPAIAPAMTAEQRRQTAQQDLIVSAAFARIVGILMRTPQYKHYTLTDLEWLIVPPLLLGQFAIMDTQIEGVPLPVPAAVALWANVSVEVDARLSQNLKAPVRLRPDEWRSGDKLWVMDLIGDQRAFPQLLARLKAGVAQGREMRGRLVGASANVPPHIVAARANKGVAQ